MKVAFNRINITPNDYLGKPLAGYSRKDSCQGKLDDIHAYGVLISNNSDKGEETYFLLISVDILKLPLSIVTYIKNKLISKFSGLKSNNILLHATHSHASFDLTGEFYYTGGALAFIKGVMFADNKSDKYIVWMANRIVNLTEKLFKTLEPCKFAWKKEKFNPGIVLNRRWPTREVFPDLGVISFKGLNENKYIGIVINYACHPTTLSHKNSKLSADYPGAIIKRIDKLTNNKVATFYFNGPSGDLNPITTSGDNFEKINGDKSLTYDQLGTYEDTIKIGYLIADEAIKLANSIPDKDYHNEIEILSYNTKLYIPKKDAKYFSKVWFSNTLKWVFKKYFLMKIAKFDKKSVNFPFFTEEKKQLKKYAKTVVQYIEMLTEHREKLGIITIPGELFEGIGKKLIKESPTSEKDTFIIQNCQDWVGYLFSLDTYITEGGYEPFMCYSPLCGVYIEAGTKNLLKKVKRKV